MSSAGDGGIGLFGAQAWRDVREKSNRHRFNFSDST